MIVSYGMRILSMVALECIMVDGVFGENCDILDVVVMLSLIHI